VHKWYAYKTAAGLSLAGQVSEAFVMQIFGAARGQQPAMPVIRFLHTGSPDDPIAVDQLRAFRGGLAEAGYIEGRNVASLIGPKRDEAIDLVLTEMGYRPTYGRLVASVARDNRETRHAFEMLDLAGRIVDALR
jgi:hypothetical protein